MTVVGDAIRAELERKGRQTEAQAITASPIQAGWDDHGAEDDIDSLMASIDQVLELHESQDNRGTQVTVEPSPSQFWIGIPEFRDIKKATPAGARVTTSGSSFGDLAHSLRLRPRG